MIETPRQPERRRLPRYRMLESTLPPEASPLRTDSPAGEPNGPVVALTFRATVDQPQRIVPPHCCFTLASGAQPGALSPVAYINHPGYTAEWGAQVSPSATMKTACGGPKQP